MPNEDARFGKPNKNTSKTARVLGLLTSSSSEAPLMPSAAPVQVPAPPVHVVSSPVRAVDDAMVEAEVRGALERELEGALLGDEAAAGPEQASGGPQFEPWFASLEDFSGGEADVAGDEAPPSGGEADGPAAAPPEPEPAPLPSPGQLEDALGPKSRLEPHLFCFNVTQALVEAKVDKYIELFGLCRCPRCRVDVVALSLSNLPSKYVVARRNELVPLLSACEEKYSAAIVSQVMNACRVVMEHPRHDQ